MEEAEPEERQRAVTYLEKSIKNYIASNASKKAFANINSKAFTDALVRATNNPSTLKETVRYGSANMCGVYAFTYVYALYDPVKFVQGAAELLITGQAQDIGGLTVKAETGLMEEKDDLAANSLPVFVFGGSLRSHYNNFSKGVVGRYFGSTNSATMKAWLEDRLNLKVSEFEYGHETIADGITENDLTTLINHVNSGKQALLRLNAGQYRKGQNATKFDPEGDFSGGDHWVVLNGVMNLNKSEGTITFFSYDNHDGLVQKTMKTETFRDMINHVLMIERKKEEKKE